MRTQQRSVGALAELCGFSAANVSRHLSLLSRKGFVVREARGQKTYFRTADESTQALCDRACGSIAQRLEARGTLGAGGRRCQPADPRPRRMASASPSTADSVVSL